MSHWKRIIADVGKKSHCGEPHNSSLDHLKSKNQKDFISLEISAGSSVEFFLLIF